MTHRFDQRLVGVQQLHVLADHGDGDFVLGVELGVDDLFPLGEVSAAALQAKTFDHKVVQPLGVQDARDLVDGVGIFQRDDRTLFNVGELRDLATRRHIDGVVGTADQHIRLQADGAQFLDRVLCRLGLGFAGGRDVRNQGQVHQHRALGADFETQLTDSFQKRLRFDITDRTADFDQGDIGIARTLDDATLDLVGDMRDDLNGRTQIITTALLAQYVLIDTARGEVVVLGHGRAYEPLVVAQVEVGFGAIMGDEHFTVLEGAHGPWIDVDVRIQLEHGDFKPPRLKDRRQ